MEWIICAFIVWLGEIRRIRDDGFEFQVECTKLFLSHEKWQPITSK